MANNTTTVLSDSIRAQYQPNYEIGAVEGRVYDQVAVALPTEMARGSSAVIPFLSRLEPSEQTISETADLATVTFADTTVSVTPTSRGNSIVISELFALQNYTNGMSAMVQEMGRNAEESIEQLAIAVLAGNGITRSPAARASLSAGTASHLMNAEKFFECAVLADSLKIPQFATPRGMRRIAILHPYSYKDLFGAGGVVQAVGAYQNSSMLLSHELGELHGWSIVVSPFAKAFWGAGADAGSVVATTLNGAVAAMATSIVVASASNIAVGQTLTIGTEETGTTYYPTNELVTVTAVNGTTISIAGGGSNGGLQFAHATGIAVRNADNVFMNIFGGESSIAKIYNAETGPYGKVIPLHMDGDAEQFYKMAWKFYGNYGLISNSRFIRVETASSMDA